MSAASGVQDIARNGAGADGLVGKLSCIPLAGLTRESHSGEGGRKFSPPIAHKRAVACRTKACPYPVTKAGLCGWCLRMLQEARVFEMRPPVGHITERGNRLRYNRKDGYGKKKYRQKLARSDFGSV